MTPTERIALIRDCKSAGLLPEQVWTGVVKGIDGSKMRLACQSASVAEWFEAFERVFGKEAAGVVRARKFKAL